MVDLEETSTIMAISMTEVMIKKRLKIKRRESRRQQTQPAIPKKVVNKVKVQYLRYHQPQANKAVHRITMTVRKRKLKLQARRSDIRH